jgi:Tfp pilus assembly protein PilW
MGKNRSGQSLIEVIVTIVVVTLIVTGLTVAVITSMKSAQSARARSTGAKLTQDGIEIIRNLRDKGWNTFIGNIGEFCLQDASGLSGSPPCPDIEIGSMKYKRTVEFVPDASNEKMTVNIKVEWNEGEEIRTSSATTYFTKWR